MKRSYFGAVAVAALLAMAVPAYAALNSA